METTKDTFTKTLCCRAVAAVKAWIGQRKQRRIAQMERRLELEAQEAVQIMEYDGELYLGLHRTPVMPVDGLKWSVPDVLIAARGAYVKRRKEAHHGAGA